ncbi:MAG: divalent-cation tolerance protein CutA [Chthoniobacterales bacterium]
MADEAWLVVSTFPDPETARRISRQMVDEHLAACANLTPTIQSIYRWEGKVEEAQETMVFFKTTPARFPELQARLKSLHPYDVPEIIAVPIRDGLPDYLRWVSENCVADRV